MSLEEKVKLLEECINGRIRQREAARRAGVTIGSIQRWLSHYRTGGKAALEHSGRRRVYSKETKRSAVEEYLCGSGSLLSISEKYQISTPSLLLEWVQVYHRHNNTQTEEGEIVMAGRRTYTLEERVQIVKEHLEDGKTISELAVEHGLGYRLVYDWVKKYQTKGLAGLEDRRGQRTASQEPRTPEEELRVRIAQLERENDLLRLECDLLKKVKELERGED